MNSLLLFCFSIVFTITSSFPFGQAPVIDSVISSPQVCTGTSTGASITIYAQGTGNSYFLTGPVNTIPQSGNMFSDIPSGTYSVTVANSFGSVQETGIIIYDQSSALQLPTLQTQETSCIGGSDGYVVVSANGGQAPYNFIINSGPVQPPSLNSNGVDTIFGLSASIIYNIEVTDACGQQINLGFEIEDKNLVNLPLPSGNVMWPAGSSSNNCDSVALFYLPPTPSNTENRQAYPLTFNFVSLDLLHPNITVIHDVFPNQLQQVYLAQGDWRYIVEDACGRIDSVDFSTVNQQMIVQTNAAASSGSCSPRFIASSRFLSSGPGVSGRKKIITSCDVLEIYDNTGNIVLSLDSSSQYNDGTSWSAPETLLPGPGQYTFKLINTCCGDTLQVVKTIDTIDMNFSFYDFVSNVGYDNTAGIEIQIGQIPPSNNYFIWDSINAPSFYIPTPGTANNYDTVFGPILNDTIHLPNNANKFKLGSFPLGTYYFRMGNSYCGIEDTFTIVVTNSDLINFSYNTQYVQKCEGLSQIHVLHNSTEDSRGSVTIRNQANQIVGFNYNMASGDTAIATNLNSSSLYTLRYSRRNPVLELFALSGEAGVMYDTLLTPPQPFPVIDSITYNCTEGDSSWVFIHANGLNPIKYRHRLYGELSFGPYQYVDSFYLTNGNTFEFMLEDTCGNSSSTYIQGICTPSVVLPSTVIDFEATVRDCSNLLSWTSISENNSLGYRVERSFNLLNWENCCWIESQGNSNSPIDYSCRDDQILGSLQKHVYYRLTHIDVDGKEQLHGIRAVDISDCLNTAIRMYPNPTNGLSTIFSMVDGEAELIDTTGRSMGWFRLKKGENIRDMTALAPGVYTIKVDLITGAVYSYRFIKS